MVSLFRIEKLGVLPQCDPLYVYMSLGHFHIALRVRVQEIFGLQKAFISTQEPYVFCQYFMNHGYCFISLSTGPLEFLTENKAVLPLCKGYGWSIHLSCHEGFSNSYYLILIN